MMSVDVAKGKSPWSGQTDTIDPDVWSGRALQEVFVELAAVLHQCIWSLIGAGLLRTIMDIRCIACRSS
jgi:hypothetical protein